MDEGSKMKERKEEDRGERTVVGGEGVEFEVEVAVEGGKVEVEQTRLLRAAKIVQELLVDRRDEDGIGIRLWERSTGRGERRIGEG